MKMFVLLFSFHSEPCIPFASPMSPCSTFDESVHDLDSHPKQLDSDFMKPFSSSSRMSHLDPAPQFHRPLEA